MKKLYCILIIFSTVVTLICSCKKDTKSQPQPVLIVPGDYRITAIEEINSTNGTTTNETFSGCGADNTEIFAANGGYYQTTACNTDTLKGTYIVSQNVLTLYDADGEIADKGTITNLSSTGFTIDENAINFAPDKVTFVKL